MAIPIILFYVFSLVAVMSAVMVIVSKNPVYSVMFLILAFFNAAGLFVLLGAEFLAMLLVIVYVGAVAVLFLFVVMMLNINVERLREGFLRYLPLGAAIAIVLFVELFFVMQSSILQIDGALSAKVLQHPVDAEMTNTLALGKILYTDYFLVFQLSGVVLLVAMIGAIVLTHRRREGVRKQVILEQLSRDPKKTVELVSVETGKGVS